MTEFEGTLKHHRLPLIAQVMSKAQKTLNVLDFAHLPDEHVGAIEYNHDVLSNLVAEKHISNCSSPTGELQNLKCLRNHPLFQRNSKAINNAPLLVQG